MEKDEGEWKVEESFFEGELDTQTEPNALVIIDPVRLHATSPQAQQLTAKHIADLDQIMRLMAWHLSANADPHGHVQAARNLLRRRPLPAKLFNPSKTSTALWIARSALRHQLPTNAELGIVPEADHETLTRARRLGQAIRVVLTGQSMAEPTLRNEAQKIIEVAARKALDNLGVGRAHIVAKHIRAMAAVCSGAGFEPTVAHGRSDNHGTPFTRLVCALLNMPDPVTGKPIYGCTLDRVFDLCRNHTAALKGRAKRRVFLRTELADF